MKRDKELDDLIRHTQHQIAASLTLLEYLRKSTRATRQQIRAYRKEIELEMAYQNEPSLEDSTRDTQQH